MDKILSGEAEGRQLLNKYNTFCGIKRNSYGLLVDSHIRPYSEADPFSH